jgi:hypothetical protein
VYERNDSLLIAYASWAKDEVSMALNIDWNKTGMMPDDVQITMPSVDGLQAGRKHIDLKDMKVPAGGGGIILITKK